MSKTRHTPAQWTVVPGRGYKIEQWKGDAKEDVGNIALIAAAPEMLEALERLVALVLSDKDASPDTCKEAFVTAQKAIEKAKGENV